MHEDSLFICSLTHLQTINCVQWKLNIKNKKGSYFRAWCALDLPGISHVQFTGVGSNKNHTSCNNLQIGFHCKFKAHNNILCYNDAIRQQSSFLSSIKTPLNLVSHVKYKQWKLNIEILQMTISPWFLRFSKNNYVVR